MVLRNLIATYRWRELIPYLSTCTKARPIKGKPQYKTRNSETLRGGKKQNTSKYRNKLFFFLLDTLKLIPCLAWSGGLSWRECSPVRCYLIIKPIKISHIWRKDTWKDTRSLTYAPKELQRRLGCLTDRETCPCFCLTWMSHTQLQTEIKWCHQCSALSAGRLAGRSQCCCGWTSLSLGPHAVAIAEEIACGGCRLSLCSWLLLHPGSLWSFLPSSFLSL